MIPIEDEHEPRAEQEAVALVKRYQAGDSEALRQLHAQLEVTIIAILQQYRAAQPPPVCSLEDLLEQSWTVLADLARAWKSFDSAQDSLGGSFLGYFMRSFPGAIARSVRQAWPAGKISPHPLRGRGQVRGYPAHDAAAGSGGGPSPEAAQIWQGPFLAAELARLPALERQIVTLRALELQDMNSIARQVGVTPDKAYGLYRKAHWTLTTRRRLAMGRGSIAMRRLVTSLHVAATATRRAPGRDWVIATTGLNRAEYEELMALLVESGAIRSRCWRHSGYLVEPTIAATLARVERAGGSSPEP